MVNLQWGKLVVTNFPTSKVGIAPDGASHYCVTPDTVHWSEFSIISVVFLPELQGLCLVMKILMKSCWRYFYRVKVLWDHQVMGDKELKNYWVRKWWLRHDMETKCSACFWIRPWIRMEKRNCWDIQQNLNCFDLDGVLY